MITCYACYWNSYTLRILLLLIAIDKVAGVVLTCESIDLINQCTVMWTVSLCISIYTVDT